MGEIQTGLAIVVAVIAFYGLVWKVNPSANLVNVLFAVSACAFFLFMLGALVYEAGVNNGNLGAFRDCQINDEEQLEMLAAIVAQEGFLSDDTFDLFESNSQAGASSCLNEQRIRASALERSGFFFFLAACFLLPQFIFQIVVTYAPSNKRDSDEEDD